jgi:hypothetical protein
MEVSRKKADVCGCMKWMSECMNVVALSGIYE